MYSTTMYRNSTNYFVQTIVERVKKYVKIKKQTIAKQLV